MSADGDGPDWLGLLKWSLAQTDGTSDSDARPMSEEDVQFLTNVMESLVADEPKRMREMMVEIAAFLDESIEEEKGEHCPMSQLSREMQQERMIDIFEELRDITCQIDMSVFFATKLRGIACILDVLENRKGLASDQVRCCAASAIATLSQNNAEVQASMFKSGLISRLVTLALSLMTGTEIGSGVIPNTDNLRIDKPKILAKVLFAISSSVIAHPMAEEVFVRGQFGPDMLKCIMSLPLINPDSPENEGTVGLSDRVNGTMESILPLKSRATRLCRALIISDSATADRIKTIAAVVVPGCYSDLSYHEDLEMRANSVGLLLDLLKTPEGREVIDERGSDRITNALTATNERLRYEIGFADDFDKPQLETDLAAVRECMVMLSGPPPPPSTQGRGQPQGSRSAAGEEVLMLGR